MLRRLVRWILRTVIVVGVLIAIVAVSQYLAHRIQSGSVLLVTLDGPVVERGQSGVLGLLSAQQTPLNFVRNAIDRAGRDPKIVGLAIKVIDPQMDLAQGQEIATLIKSFRAHGKWTAAYVESAGESAPGNMPFIVAAATGDVSLMPQGEMNIVGVGMRELFARGTLDWLGITPNFAAIGKYKSAANIFTEKAFTPGQKEEDEALTTAMYDQITAEEAAERKLPLDTIKSLVDEAPLEADDALKAKLVDRLEYEDQFDERMKSHGGGHHKLVDYADYARGGIFSGLTDGDRIAVVYGEGDIVRGNEGIDPFSEPGGESMTASDMMDAFKDAREDDSVVAVVFRINSPGGSVIASELIRREVALTAKEKPVVVSMSGLAASGGYWVATPAAKIVAEPGTITGSIGVLGGKFNITPAAAKLYANTDSVTHGANVEMFDEFTDFTPAQATKFRDQLLGTTYNYFLKIVASGRHMNVEQVDQIAQGRVWSGEEALKIKLVDSLGGLDDAVKEAKTLARIPTDQIMPIEELPEQPGVLQALAKRRLTASVFGAIRGRGAIDPIIQIIRASLSRGGSFVAAYCPVIPIW
jgi:protease IV